MASIRLEDEARKDPRFVVLGKKLGTTKFDARARMEELWAYCTEKQTYYLSETIIDALAEFDGFCKLICNEEIGLAEHSLSGIRIKGTKGRIEWLKKLRNNGKKGGRPKKTKTKPEGNQEVTKTEPPSNPLTLTLAPVLINKEIQDTETNAVAVAPAETAVAKRSKFSEDTRAKMVTFIRTYAEAWKAKYKSNPEGIRDKALIGKIGHWISAVSEQRAKDLVQVYLQVDYRPINESCHDLWQFFRHLNRIGIAVDSGQDIGGINWGDVFGRTG